MTTTQKILSAAGIVLIAIQFFRPERTAVKPSPAKDISAVVAVPDSVQLILDKACYDCHSYKTRYPWYYHIQPAGWFLSGHIREGRSHLNFNEFTGYSQRKKAAELGEVAEHVEENTMPLRSYKLIHWDARLSESEKSLLIGWARSSADTLSAHQE
jgi:hypothetical protein